MVREVRRSAAPGMRDPLGGDGDDKGGEDVVPCAVGRAVLVLLLLLMLLMLLLRPPMRLEMLDDEVEGRDDANGEVLSPRGGGVVVDCADSQLLSTGHRMGSGAVRA